MEGEGGLGMTRIPMSTLNVCSGNQCEWSPFLLPLWTALSCLQLDLVTLVALRFSTSSPCLAL